MLIVSFIGSTTSFIDSCSEMKLNVEVNVEDELKNFIDKYFLIFSHDSQFLKDFGLAAVHVSAMICSSIFGREPTLKKVHCDKDLRTITAIIATELVFNIGRNEFNMLKLTQSHKLSQLGKIFSIKFVQ